MKHILTVMAFICLAISLNGFSVNLRNRLAATGQAWLTDADDKYELAFLWQPELVLEHKAPKGPEISGQLLYNAYVRQRFRTGQDEFVQRGKVQAIWLAMSGSQSEARLGLQRVNFGSAQMLRPLQLFDTLNPTDKLELTEGVKALLLRHYFLNNSNLWMWGILGDEKPKGNALTATKENAPELGGRAQFPLGRGEAAVTVNYRTETMEEGIETGYAYSLGFDCKQSLLTGIWLEGNLQKVEKPVAAADWELPVTIGVDYTFGLGTGLYTMLETGVDWQSADKLSGLSREELDWAATVSYRLGLLDKLFYYCTLDDKGENAVHTAVWRRDYDRLSWDLSCFWDGGSNHGSYRSRGVKAMVAYIF